MKLNVKGRIGKAARTAFALFYFLSGLLLSGCASLYVDELGAVARYSAEHGLETETGVESCRASLNRETKPGGPVLDASSISLVNWNVRKQTDPEADEDLSELSNGKDLVLIQEASLREETINGVDATRHWSFAPGYRPGRAVTGVMTLSSIKPLTQCSFVSLEPVIRVPKATSITEYALNSTDETLVVVNIHAINFTAGVAAFRQQFEQVLNTLRDHDGPLILSGDLNTWRRKRMQIVEEFADKLGLEPIEFGDDHRVKVMGNVLDHIYVRGLSAIEASTKAVTSSDHNPMSATFAL